MYYGVDETSGTWRSICDDNFDDIAAYRIEF